MSLLGVLNPVSLSDEERHSSPEVCINAILRSLRKKNLFGRKSSLVTCHATFTVGWKKKAVIGGS